MRWRKRKGQYAPVKTIFEIPYGTLARKTVYDSMIGDPESTSNLIGLPPVSDEVDEMERSASESRLERVSVLTGVLMFQSQIISEAALAYQIDQASIEIPEEMLDMFMKSYFAVAFSAALSTVSNLVDLDILHMAGD